MFGAISVNIFMPLYKNQLLRHMCIYKPVRSNELFIFYLEISFELLSSQLFLSSFQVYLKKTLVWEFFLFKL